MHQVSRDLSHLTRTEVLHPLSQSMSLTPYRPRELLNTPRTQNTAKGKQGRERNGLGVWR